MIPTTAQLSTVPTGYAEYAYAGESDGTEINRDAIDSMRWGVKRSFLDYVRRMPDGTVECSDGALAFDGGDFAFPESRLGHARSIDGDVVEWRFAGTVHFTAHGGMLDVPVSDPSIVMSGDETRLMIADPVDHGRRIKFADLKHIPPGSRSGDADEVARFTSAVTQFSAELMGGVYPLGTKLEPISIVGD